MERVQFNTIMKKIFAIVLIVAILLPYFPKMTFATQVAEPEEVTNLVTNNVNWKSGNQTEEGTSSQEFTIQYSVTFNRITTGFRNVDILVYTDQVQGVNDVLTVDSSAAGTKETGNGYATIHHDAVNTGINYTGEVNVQFGKANTELNRKLNYKVTGYYTDPEKGEMYFETPVTELNAHIVPDPDNFPFNYGLSFGKYNGGMAWYNDSPEIITQTSSLGQNDNGTSKGWYTSLLEVRYPIEVKAYEKAQKVQLQVTFDRYDYTLNEQTGENDLKVSQMGYGHWVDWGELDDDLGTPVKTNNSDGSVTYTFTKGTDSNVYNENNVFSINKKYNVYVVYDSTHSNPVLYGDDATARSNFDFVANLQASGFKIEETYDNNTKQLNRTVTYQEKTANLGDTRAENLYLYTPGDHTWVNLTADSITVGNEEYQSNSLDENIMEIIRTDKKVEIKAIIDAKKIGESMQYDSSTGEFSDWENITGKVIINPPSMGYIDDSEMYYGRLGGVSMGGRMTLKSIKPLEGTTGRTGIATGISNGDLAYSTINQYIEPNTTFMANSNSNFNSYVNRSGYCIFLEDFLNKEFTGYELTYTLDMSNDTNEYIEHFVNNCLDLAVNFKANKYNNTMYNTEWLQGNDGFILYGPDNNFDRSYSYFTSNDAYTDNLASSSDKLNKWESKRITATMKALEEQAISGKPINNKILNVNPTFYLELPQNFSYKNIKVTVGNSLSIKKQYIKKYNGKKYLVFECNGTYDSSISSSENITITFDRKLVNDSSSSLNYGLTMFTENENYYGASYSCNYNENKKRTTFDVIIWSCWK